MESVTFYWTCPKCHHVHQWRWLRRDYILWCDKARCDGCGEMIVKPMKSSPVEEKGVAPC